MKNTYAFSIIILLFGLSTPSCTTLKDAADDKGNGVIQIYDTSYDKVWQELKNVMNLEGLEIVSELKEEGTILAQRGMKVFSYGENVAIFVERINSDRTSVEVVNKKAISTNITAKNWSKIIHKRMKEQLIK